MTHSHNIPPHWKRVKLGDVFTPILSYSFSRDMLSYESGTIKYIHYGDIHKRVLSNYFNVSTYNSWITDSLISKIKENSYLQTGAVIIPDASEDVIGTGTAIEIYNPNNEKIVSGLHTIALRPNLKEIYCGFGHLLFKNTEVKRNIEKKAQGTKVYSISFNHIKSLELLLPPIEEQAWIVEKILAFDRLINITRALLSVKKRLLESLRIEVFHADKSQLQKVKLSSVVHEHKLKSTGKEDVFSVSIHKGLINQIKHLGRSFSAKNTDKYNIVQYGDIVYTKSPTGDFPMGIIKQSLVKNNVIVSPLYGVYTPQSFDLGVFLDFYFESPKNA